MNFKKSCLMTISLIFVVRCSAMEQKKYCFRVGKSHYKLIEFYYKAAEKGGICNLKQEMSEKGRKKYKQFLKDNCHRIAFCEGLESMQERDYVVKVFPKAFDIMIQIEGPLKWSDIVCYLPNKYIRKVVDDDDSEIMSGTQGADGAHIADGNCCVFCLVKMSIPDFWRY